MKNLLLGTDICQISRIEKAYERFGVKFLEKTFTSAEISYSTRNPRNMFERLSVRFATKEAISKALGVGINKMGWSKGIDWKDVEIVREDMGSVNVILHNKALKLSNNFNIKEWKVSVSHNGDYATSTVIGIIL